MTKHPGSHRLTVGTTGFVLLGEDDGAIVSTELAYWSDDCLAVRLALLGPAGQEVARTFAWELLATGLMFRAGDGDITVRPAPGPIGGIEVSLLASSAVRVWLPGTASRSSCGRYGGGSTRMSGVSLRHWTGNSRPSRTERRRACGPLRVSYGAAPSGWTWSIRAHGGSLADSGGDTPWPRPPDAR